VAAGWFYGLGLGLLCAAPIAGAAEFRDAFAARELLSGPAGEVVGSNVGATVEPGEPRHGGKRGGASVWIAWQAPANGVVRFSTEGSELDTLLGVYTFARSTDTSLDRLREAGEDDDEEDELTGRRTSRVEVGVRAGEVYHIAVDGYRGATGSLRLSWTLEVTPQTPPLVVGLPRDRAARQGDPLVLRVLLTGYAGEADDVELRWRRNGESLGVRGPTLEIPGLRTNDLGRYTLRIRIGDVQFETAPVELQINSDGLTNSLARDKLFDALDTPLVGDDGESEEDEDEDEDGADEEDPPEEPQPTGLSATSRPGLPLRAGRVTLKRAGAARAGPALAGLGVARGYNGSQVFSTVRATSDPDEPQPCGVVSGGSHWFAYEPATNGLLTLDTRGSDFDTVLAVFTYTNPPASYADLVLLGCDNDRLQAGGADQVSLPVEPGRPYLVRIAGVRGETGIARLNYVLQPAAPAQAPRLAALPAVQRVALGQECVLQADVRGAEPLFYSWLRGGEPLPGETNAQLRLRAVAPEISGTYILTVSNAFGGPLEVPFEVRVLVPPTLKWQPIRPGAHVLDAELPPAQYHALEGTESPLGPWRLLTPFVTGTNTFFPYVPPLTNGVQIYRLRVE
jgi:hypothetical protein